MRLRALRRRKRQSLAWCFIGFAVVQAALAIAIDQCWPTIRDSQYCEVERIIRTRQAQDPTRPLVLAIGSSRTQFGLVAADLNAWKSDADPIVINAALPACGPMLGQIVLRRLLSAGLRPASVFLEVMPMSLSARTGGHVEERYKTEGRYSGDETVRLWKYYDQPYRLGFQWAKARIFPCTGHQFELREALGLDRPPSAAPEGSGGVAFGGNTYGETLLPEDIERKTRGALEWYRTALIQPALSPGAWLAFRDLLELCRDEKISVVLVVPPEGSAFRTLRPTVAERQLNAVRDLAREFSVPLVSAHDWIADDGFWDGHHLTATGARRFTERFDREVLKPMTGRASVPASLRGLPVLTASQEGSARR